MAVWPKSGEYGLTRAQVRKRRLVWAKIAPIYAPHYDALRLDRYVPATPPGGGRWVVYDRLQQRCLSNEELVRVRDRDLADARHLVN